MQKYPLEQWLVEGELLTPIHIGCGSTLDVFTIAYDKTKGCLVEFDLPKAVQASDRTLQERLNNRLNSTIYTIEHIKEIMKLLHETPWDQEGIKIAEYELTPRVKNDFDNDPYRELLALPIHSFAHSELTKKRILPGSSLKGSMRTGLVSQSALNLGQYYQNHLQFEHEALRFATITDDPLGEWGIADAEFLNGQSMFTRVEIHHRKTGKKQEVPDLFEVMPQGTKFQTTVNLRRKKLVRDENKVSIERWVQTTRKYTLNTFRNAYNSIPGGFSQLLEERLDELETKLEAIANHSDLVTAVRVGRFTGFLSMTAEKQRMLIPRRRFPDQRAEPKFGKDANPVTRPVSVDDWPLGYVKLTLKKIV
ncbi:MAG: RAMP superfamily CRISPR-associated protein [bacterium]|nr:RAMP superfamily CRISPR-associated protein [bacterium]